MSIATDHQASQHNLIELLIREIAKIFRAFRPKQPDTLQTLLTQMYALITEYAEASAGIAADAYDAERAAAGVTTDFQVPLNYTVTPEEIDASVRWAVHGLFGDEPTQDPSDALTQLEGVGERYALDAARTTVDDASQADEDAIGWERVAEPDACYFCALLAQRGPVYKSEGRALKSKDNEQSFHDHCRCVAMPVYGTWEPDERVKEWQEIYNAGPPSMQVFRNAYNKHYGYDR